MVFHGVWKMKYKKSMIIIILAIFLFSITGIWAGDVNGTAVTDEDNSVTDFTQTDNNPDMDYINSGNYSGLAEEIKNRQYVDLKHDYYTYDYGETIKISVNNAVINGNGAVIDMVGSDIHAFYVSASGVTIKNMTIKNVKFHDHGGAVFWNGGGGCVSNCIFTNNTAERGGAVFWNGDGGCVFNSTFIDNSADRGGAVYWNVGSGCVLNSTFTANNAVIGGGAVYWNGDRGRVFNSTFTDNTAGSMGGAVYWNVGSGCVLNSTFIGNTVNLAFDAIRSTEYLSANCCWFGNTAADYTLNPPVSGSVDTACRLFLNATAKPNPVNVLDTSDVIFKLYLYNSTSANITEYDNAPFKNLNFTVTSTNGIVNNTARPGEIITYPSKARGTGSVTASIENIKYTIEITNRGLDSHLSADYQKIYYSNNTVITINYNSSATGTVNITLKGKNNTYTFTDKGLNSTVSLGNISPDEYNMTIIYSGDETFLPAGAEANLTVQLYADISVVKTSDKDVYFLGDEALWTVTVYNIGEGINATGVYLVDNFFPGDYFEIINWTVTKGSFQKNIGNQYIWNIDNLANGDNATLKIFACARTPVDEVYNFAYAFANEDDCDYDNNFANKSVSVRKLNSKVNVSDVTLDYGQTANTTATTEGAVNITARIGDENLTVYNNTIIIPHLDAGTYTLTVTTVPDENYTAADANATVTVRKIESQLTSQGLTTVYQIHRYLVANIKDSQGNPISDVYADITINGVTYSCKTDRDGNAWLIIRLNPKTYTATVTFEDKNHNRKTITADVVVTKSKLKIIAKNKSFRRTNNVKKYTVRLKDHFGNPIKRAKLKLKVNGKTYKAKTNRKGKATFKIRNLMIKGVFKAKIKFKTNWRFKTTSKTVRIKVI